MAATDTKPKGGKPDKLIRDALIAAQRQDPERLKRVAEKFWTKAEDGDQAAVNFIADRIDGKAVQPIAGDEENPLRVITRIERHIIDSADPENQDS